MSNLIMLKRNKTRLKRTFTALMIAVFTVFLGANLAYAGPEKTPDKAQEKPVVEEMVDDAAEGAVEGEGTIDLTPKVAEPMDDKTKPAMTIPAETQSGQKCYAQKDGTEECVCENTDQCAALKASETCEPGSFWGKEDSFAGCTKKKATPKE